MRFRSRSGNLAVLLFASLLPVASLAAPEVGRPAPPFLFEGPGVELRSADYVGESARKKGVVVAWFPKAFTPG